MSPGLETRTLDGKALAREIRRGLKQRIQAGRDARGRPPHLAVVLVGDDPASATYVAAKQRAARRIGVDTTLHRFEADMAHADLLELVDRLAADRGVDGILVQLPLPGHMDADEVLARIPPDQDVDGFHVANIGRLALGDEARVACTPKGVIRMLEAAGFAFEGARALVIGRSRIVGRPVSMLLTNRNATVTLAHSRTRDLAARVAEADLVVAAAGKAELVRGAWLKPGAWVVDVGIHRAEAGGLVGDVAAAEARGVAGALSPVPGGVGPMTVAMLMENTVEAWEAHLSSEDPAPADQEAAA